MAGPHTPSLRTPHVALEVSHGVVGVGAEDAVHPPAVEPHVRQPPLQGHDVVADLHVPGGEEHDTVAESPTGLFQSPERLWSDDAVHSQALLLLKSPDGTVHDLVEGGAGVFRE